MRSALVTLAVVFSACPPPPPAAPSLTGDDWTLTADDAGTLTFARGDMTLLTLPPDTFQLGTVPELDPELSYDPYWLVIDDGIFTPTPPTGFAWRTASAASVAMDGDALVLTLTYRAHTATVRFTKADQGHLAAEFVPVGDGAIGYLRVKPVIDGSEGLYGLGEWFDSANHRGKLRPLQLEADLTVESASTENHVAVPLLLGSRGWGVFVETTRHGVIDVAKTDATRVDAMFGTAEVSHAGLKLHFFSAADPMDLPREYFRVTAFPRAPADWAMGPWLWRDESRDQAEVEDDVRQLRDLDLATSAMWIDRPYASFVNSFDFEPTKYPDAGGMVDTMHAAGLRLALWHTPYVEEGAPQRSAALPLFPPQQGTHLNRWSAPLDFTDPAAVVFWRNQLSQYSRLEVEGYKLDFAEDVIAGVSGKRSGWTFENGATDRTMTDGYPRAYHAVYRATLANNDGFLLVRAARWGEQASGVVVWPGDIDATLTRFGETFMTRGGENVVGVGGLPSAIRAGVSLSMSGFPFFAADTGGYRHSPPDKETFMRWTQQSALMPVMQTGDSSSQPPWVYTPENGRDAEALDTYRFFSRLHLRLFPFFWAQVRSMRDTGRPIVRAFGLAFPRLGVHPEDQYLLGDALLVAPIETRGATSRSVVKPPGRWFNFFTGEELLGEAGAAVTVQAALTELPLFIREGALVPMLRPTIDTLSPSTDPGVESFANEAGTLWVRVQPGDGEFVLADGTALTQSGQVLVASAGSQFKTSVVWEVRTASTATPTHAGAALSEVADLDAVAQGFAREGTITRIKTPLDGLTTTW